MAAVSMERLHKDILELKQNMEYVKHLLEEDYELSEWAKRELAQARTLPDSKLVSHADVKKRILER